MKGSWTQCGDYAGTTVCACVLVADSLLRAGKVWRKGGMAHVIFLFC